MFDFCYFSLRALSCRTVEKFLLCFLLVRESDRTHKKCFDGADYTIFLFRYISKILFGLLGTGSVCMCLAATTGVIKIYFINTTDGINFFPLLFVVYVGY